MRDEVDTNSKKPRKIGVLFAFAFFVIIILIGLYVLGASKKSSSPIVPTVTVTPTIIPVVTKGPDITDTPTGKQTPTPSPKSGKISPTPTPTKQSATLDRSKLKVAVLNGSGIAGAAKNISSYLSGLGYDVTTVGNAKTFDYTNLTIVITKAKSPYLTLLKKDLAQKSASISATVDDTINTDAEVIIGK